MNTHAPGPWLVDRDADGLAWTGSFAIGSPDGGHVCHTTRHVTTVSLADAHLIAAAPELLAACQAAGDAIFARGLGKEEPFNALLLQLAAAKKKAEGR